MKNILKIFFTISLLVNGLIAFCQPPPAWQLDDIIFAWTPRIVPSNENLDSTWNALWRRGNGSYISGTPTHYSIFTDSTSLGDGYLTQLGNYVRIPEGKNFSATDTTRCIVSISKDRINIASNSTLSLANGYSAVRVDSSGVRAFYVDGVPERASSLDILAGKCELRNNTQVALNSPSVNIGSTPIATYPSAILTATSTTKGFLPPRLTTTQRDAIASPVEGLMIYDVTTHKVAYYNGTIWVEP